MNTSNQLQKKEKAQMIQRIEGFARYVRIFILSRKSSTIL